LAREEDGWAGLAAALSGEDSEAEDNLEGVRAVVVLRTPRPFGAEAFVVGITLEEGTTRLACN